MRRLGRLGTAVLFTAAGIGVGVAGARGADRGTEARQAAPWGSEVTAPVAVLSRLHHAAEREVQLGELAETGGASASTRRYGAELAADFRELEQRIVDTAASEGIESGHLSAVAAGENVVALKKEADDFARLANERGAPFDRDFWVTVAEGQGAAQDMLTATVTREPALVGLVSNMSQLYDRSSKRALAAASQVAPPAPEPGSAHQSQPTESQPTESQPTESPPEED
jgi:hypothetical protein